MRFPRMTTRRWMIAVAVVALTSTVWQLCQLARTYDRIAEQHSVQTTHWYCMSHVNHRAYDWADYHEQLEAKYRRAARRPWLPLPPDPPVPE